MLKPFAAVAVVAALAMPATAGERGGLADALTDMRPVDDRVAWVLWDCVDTAAKRIGEKPEPKLTDADWRPAPAS